MDVGSLRFSSHEFLTMIESRGLTGSWGWAFEGDDHMWSPGLFQLLGLEPSTVRPSFHLFLSFLHPEDRHKFSSARELKIDGISRDGTFRVIRPDRSMRHVSAATKIHLNPDGKPFKATGILLDVTCEESLRLAGDAEKARRRALFDQTKGFEFVKPIGSDAECPPELLLMTGLSAAEWKEDFYALVAAEERETFRAIGLESFSAGRMHVVTPSLRMANNESMRFTVLNVPVYSAEGVLREWSIMGTPEDFVRGLSASKCAMEALEASLAAAHFRAARAFLDWSLTDMAKASGLSMSTIRRLEHGEQGNSMRARHAVVRALRGAGINFTVNADSSISVSKR